MTRYNEMESEARACETLEDVKELLIKFGRRMDRSTWR